MKEGVLPTKNLPVKSILKDQQQTERPTNAIEKRETHFQQQTLQEQLEPSSPIYKNFDNFLARSKQLKLNLWSIIEHSKCTVEIQRREEQILLPYMQIFVCEDLSFVLRCFGWIVPEDNKIYSIHPTFKYVTLSSFITFLQGYIICSGLDLVEFREAIHLKHHIVPSLFVFDKSSKPISPVCQQEYIRSAVCRLLIPSNSTLIKCQDCRKLEVKTRSQISHQKVTTAEPAKLQAPVKFTSPERLVATLKNHRLKNKMLLNRIAEMTTALQSHSLPVDTVLNDDLVDIFKGVPTEKIPPFMKLFWEEQQKYIRTTHSSQIRYHPAVIKYCLSIAAKSPAAYNQLRLDKKEGTGVLILPSQRTLRDYRNYIRPRQGFNPAVVKELATKTSSFSESEKFVTILFDEMKVQEDLVWDKNTGNLIGYVDLGDDDINQGVLKDCEKLASHILVFLVKSIKNPMSYSFANFATDGVTSYQMFTLFWKAVSILELSCQLKVVAVVSDGAASNRKFVRMNKVIEMVANFSLIHKLLQNFIQ